MKKLCKRFRILHVAIIFLFFTILICFILTQFLNENNLSANKEAICKGDFCNGVIQDFDFTIDKQVYSFGDTIKLKINFNNFTMGETVGLKVRGIKANNGLFKINKSRQVLIKEIPYQIIYNVKVPYCSKCSGIEEGEYSLEVIIVKNGKVVESKSKNIILK